jgi:hypothetical protein
MPDDRGAAAGAVDGQRAAAGADAACAEEVLERMHNYTGSQGTSFNYNSDFSGDVIIFDKDGNEFCIPGRDILEFVAYKYALREKMHQIEAMDWRELFSV